MSEDDVGLRLPGFDVGRVPLRRAQVDEQRIVDRVREHHVGTEIGEELGAVRAGDAAGAIHDPQIVVHHVRGGVAVGPEHRDDHRAIGHRRERERPEHDDDRHLGPQRLRLRIDDARHDADIGILVDRDQRGDERHLLRERGQERALDDGPAEQRAAS